MAEVESFPNPYAARFKQFLSRSALVARQYIEAEGTDTLISAAARGRAQNVLSYTLKEAEAWSATRDLLLAMAPKMEMAGYRTDWLPYLEDGITQSQRQGDAATEAALQFQCGYLYRLMSNYAQAQTYLNASAVRYAAVGNAEGQARALNQLAYLAWQQHRYEEAERLAQEAMRLVAELSLEKAVSLSALGLVAHHQSRYTEAEKYHYEALLIRTNYGVYKEMAWSLQNLGVVSGGQGNHATEIDYFMRALALLDIVNDPARKAIIQMNLGGAYYHQKEYVKALETLAIAEQCLRQISDGFNLAKLLTTKGLCYLAQQQWDLAEQSFQDSCTLFQQLNDRSWYLNAYDGLGISYLEQEQYDRALTIFLTIADQLVQIEGTPAHKFLTATISTQIEQAQSKKMERGKSVYLPANKRTS